MQSDKLSDEHARSKRTQNTEPPYTWT